MRRVLLLAALALPCAFGYITQTLTVDGQTYTLRRVDAASMSFYLNSQVAVGLMNGGNAVFSPGSDPAAAAKAAIASWNAVSTANIHFNDLQTTTAGHDSTDCKNIIAFASSPDDISAVGGAIAVTVPAYAVSGPVCGASANAVPGTLFDTDILFSPALTFSTNNTAGTIDFQSVLTHELGHAMGANHSGLVGATMFWATAANQINQRTLTVDDKAFVTALYPAAGAGTGILSGKITASDGSPVKFALITAIDQSAGTTYGSITGVDGTFSATVAPGSYIVYAEPFNTFISSGNIYTSSGSLSPSQVTTGFLPTLLGGSTVPTATPVAAGQTASVNITVTSGASTLTTPFFATGSTITTLSSLGPAITLASGQSVDFAIGEGGIDTTTTFLVFGRGISIKAGSIHPDPNLNLGGQPLMRFTLDIPAQTDTTLATLWIVKGTSILAYSGGLVITPKTPTFTASGVVNAASYGGAGTVSPGGISSIYDSTNNSLGPTPFVQNTSYDSTGKLPASAGGVTVTFNGVAAPIYFASAGQINLQVPFEVAGSATAQVVVTNNGAASAPVTVAVAPAQPSFFTFTPQGKDAIIQNFPDYSLNSAGNPAPRGGVVILYGTGIGKLSYPLATGQPGTVPPGDYSSAFSCSFGGQSTSAYAYWNYGFVGEATWTVSIPAGAPTGAADLTCTDSASGAVTQTATIYVK